MGVTQLDQNIGGASAFKALRHAANDTSRVSGLTHCHYKYPARFSPTFARAAIETFSRPGEIVLDPYMGGGTTIVEAMSLNRQAAGCDLNSLAVFIAKVKTKTLSEREVAAIRYWSQHVMPLLSYRTALESDSICKVRTRNLDVPRARAIKKFIALALSSIDELPSTAAQDFVRCVLLNATQWALNGRKRAVTLGELRSRVSVNTMQMLDAAAEFKGKLRTHPGRTLQPTLIHGSSEFVASHKHWKHGALVDLVVTSPPYPGVHVLYHRWQVDGRKETPAPYWIANRLDGQGSAFYNFGTRKQEDQSDYFAASLKTLIGIRSVMKDGAKIVQMLAFSNPSAQLPRYLNNMRAAGFQEMSNATGQLRRIWRPVPSRTWHAQLQGPTSGAREVVLIHTAI